MPKGARGNTLRELRRVLKDDGRLLVVDYHKPEGFFGNLLLNIAMLAETATARDMINNGIENEIEANGFRIEKREFMIMGVLEAVIAGKITPSSCF